MKKSLIALAVLGLSGAALAQSSVTLYGKADAGVGKIENGTLKKMPGGTVTSGDNSNKTQFISGSTMNAYDSRIGLRATEDLGGGLSVGAWFESGLDLNNGGQAASAFWARQANVWITGNNWGTVRLGRQFTASYTAGLSYELTGTANYSVLGTTYRWATLGSRADSAFSYTTPTFNGLTAAVAFVSKNDRTDDKNVWDVAAMYGNGPVKAVLTANKVSGGKTGYQLGGRYNFSNFSVTATFVQSAGGAGFQEVRRGFELGGTARFGAFSLTLDLTRDTKNEWASGQGVNKKYTNGLLEARYSLSKRTYLYGAYLRSDSTNNYGLGVNHSF